MLATYPSVLCIVGPTATGKSRLALNLAQTFAGEIINADSRQVYRHMDIGTAKASAEERRLVPHHLLDLLEPDGRFDLATFLKLATTAIRDITSRGGLPIVVGGTGQYVWALLEGWQVPSVPPDLPLRQGLEAEARRLGPEALHRRLAEERPEAAARIHPHNARRVIRALEVHASAGSLAAIGSHKRPPPFCSLVLGLALDRVELYHRIDQRAEQMVNGGLLDEMRRLLKMGYSPDLSALSSTGYKEMALHLQGQISLPEAIQRTKHATHRLARRQHTWFRPTDPRIRWLDAADPLPKAEAQVRRFLAGEDSCGKMASDTAEGGT